MRRMICMAVCCLAVVASICCLFTALPASESTTKSMDMAKSMDLATTMTKDWVIESTAKITDNETAYEAMGSVSVQGDEVGASTGGEHAAFTRTIVGATTEYGFDAATTTATEQSEELAYIDMKKIETTPAALTGEYGFDAAAAAAGITEGADTFFALDYALVEPAPVQYTEHTEDAIEATETHVTRVCISSAPTLLAA